MEGDGGGIKRQSSIEKEPRTLNINQIDHAREAALYVVNTTTIEEALRIFTQGLEPVVRCAESGRAAGAMDGGDDRDHDEDGKYDFRNNNHSTRFPAGLRDIVSAPF